jgi:alpha-tubulin suppressor-like RCC1 family protein
MNTSTRIWFCLLFLAISQPLSLLSQTTNNNGNKRQTTNSSSERLKEDFQNLKSLFKNKKADSTQPASVASPSKSGEIIQFPPGRQVVTGNYHVLTIKDGVLYGWGDNSEGQLGLGNKSIEYSPRQIGAGDDWEQITAAAMHSLAIKKDGSLWAWGWGNNHELGLGQVNSRALIPVRVGTAYDWKKVSTAMNNTVAVKKNGSLWVWGNNVGAALGVGITPNNAVYVPTQVGRDTTWAEAVAVEHIILAIKKDGSLWSWGRKGYSDVRGYAATGDVTTTPTRIGTDNDWKKLFVHKYHGNASAVAAKQNGELWAWGSNSSAKLGMGDEIALQSPAQMKLKGQWIDFALGRDYAIAVAGDGSLWHSGNYLKWANVKAGEPNRSTRFERMKLSGKWTGVYMFQQSGVVLIDADGNLFTYGINARGELGTGSKGGSWLPQKVELPVPLITTKDQQKNTDATSQNALFTGQPSGDVKLNSVAARLFSNVKTKLSNAEKNALADLSGFVLSKTNSAQFTVKGQPPGEEFPFDVTVYPLDLNNDGKEEAIFVWGNTFWSGGAGNSSIVMGKNTAGNYVKLHESQGFVYLMTSRTQGYPDIYQEVPSPNNKYPVYKWNGREYKMVQSVTGSNALFKTLTSMDEASKKYQAKF